jgi:hypothetical protein
VPGSLFIRIWTHRGGAKVAVKVQEHCLDLYYTVGSTANGPQPTRCVVPFARTDCHFGGVRRWFRCLKCRRRVAIVYGVGATFACRRCQKLAYPSQRRRLHPADREREQAQRIRLRLGGSANLLEPFPEKPKWMRWATYRRLHTAATESTSRSFVHLRAKFGIPAQQ